MRGGKVSRTRSTTATIRREVYAKKLCEAFGKSTLKLPMPCTVVQFLVDVKRHPKPEDRTGLHQWLIRIHVKFKSDNPNKWGELRACGGYWVRRRDGKSPTSNWTYDDQLNLTKEERYPDWKGESPDLFGGESPDTKDKRNWRIGNDQHIEIFYAKVVPGVPRSNPLVNATTADDDNSHHDGTKTA